MEPRARLKCGWLVPGGSGRFRTVPGDLGDSVPICPICSIYPIYPICPICPICLICPIYRIYPDLYLSYVCIKLRYIILSHPTLSYAILSYTSYSATPVLSHPIPSTYLSIHLTTYPNLCIYLPICLSMYLAASNLFIYFLSPFPLPVFLPSYLAS